MVNSLSALRVVQGDTLANKEMNSYMKCYRAKKRSHTAVIEHGGERLVTVGEFWQVMNDFPFRTLQERVCFAVCFCTGMRSANPQKITLGMLNYPGCDRLTYSVVKNRHKIIDNTVQWRIKSDEKLLPRWLALIFKNYIDCELRVFPGELPQERRNALSRSLFKENILFPSMNPQALRTLFARIRNHFGWHDVWQELVYFDDQGNELKKQLWYRFATHGLRAGSAHLVDQITGGDVESVRRWLGHSNIKDTQRYLRRPEHEQMCRKVKALLENKDAEMMTTWTDKEQTTLEGF